MNNLFKFNDRTAEFDATEAFNGKSMGILSYVIGLLVLIPYFLEKSSAWVRFHVVQALNLLILSAIANAGISIISLIFGLIPYIGIVFTALFSIISAVISIAAFVLTIMGIVHTAQGKAVEFPVVKNLKIIKK